MANIVEDITTQEYKYGFTTDVDTDILAHGLNEDVIRTISAKKNEPQWLLDFRLKAYRKWLTMPVPTWAHLDIPDIDFQAISYYAAPKKQKEQTGEIDPEIQKTFDKLGIPLEERAALAGNMAVDAVMDSVSVKTTFRETLAKQGIIFCSISEAVREHEDLVKQYLCTRFLFGRLPEWLGTGLQNRGQRFESATDLTKEPPMGGYFFLNTSWLTSFVTSQNKTINTGLPHK